MANALGWGERAGLFLLSDDADNDDDNDDVAEDDDAGEEEDEEEEAGEPKTPSFSPMLLEAPLLLFSLNAASPEPSSLKYQSSSKSRLDVLVCAAVRSRTALSSSTWLQWGVMFEEEEVDDDEEIDGDLDLF